MTVAVLILTLGLAAANGANDVPKGVATLAGSGLTRYRRAIAWGTIATLVGCLASLALAASLTKLFSKGIVTAAPTDAFALAVLCGAAGWVALATATRLPVSTTHSIIGSLVGAGLVFAPASVAWAKLPAKLALPLLASIAVSYLISALLNRLPTGSIPECVCAELGDAAPGPVPDPRGSTAALATTAALPTLQLRVGSMRECAVHSPRASRVGLNVHTLHWISGGLTSFSRGLNDAPKIVAIGAFALPAGLTAEGLLLGVAGAMAAGSLIGGMRVARRLAEDVVEMNPIEGLKANLTTAALVGIGANRGLPMSTTHVSTAAIAGIAGTNVGRLNRRTVRDFLLAWTVTPLVAGLIAAATFALATA